MASGTKPLLWALFAAGGLVSAFTTPVLVVITGLALPLGLLGADALSYDRVLALVGHPFGKLVVFVLIFLPMWHAAHRLRLTAHDLGIHGAPRLVALLLYGAAVLGTILAAAYLLWL
jgi:fumarate reductase subunit D